MLESNGLLKYENDQKTSLAMPPIYNANYEGVNWFNRFCAIINGELHLSCKEGSYIHHIAVYTPDLYYEPVFNKVHYELLVEFSAVNYDEPRIWMACFIGTRITTKSGGDSNPNRFTNDLYASFSEKPAIYIYHGIKEGWPYGSLKIPVTESFSKMTKISVIDEGDFITFSRVLENDVRELIFKVDLSGEFLLIYDNNQKLIYEADNNLQGKKGGYFRIFNHFAHTVVSSVCIIKHEVESGAKECVFEDSFKYFKYSSNYMIVQFASQDNPFVINNTITNITKEQLLLISPYEVYTDLKYYNIKFILQFNAEYLNTYFSDTLIQSFTDKFNSKIINIPSHKLMQLQEITNKLKDTKHLQSTQFLRLGEILCLINEFEITKENIPSNDNEVSHIIDYITANFKYIDNIDVIAKHFYISKSHLCRMFKKGTNKTIISYINQIKVSHACKLLSETELSVTEICTESGFNYCSYFASVFKDITGKTPSDYRNRT